MSVKRPESTLQRVALAGLVPLGAIGLGACAAPPSTGYTPAQWEKMRAVVEPVADRVGRFVLDRDPRPTFRDDGTVIVSMNLLDRGPHYDALVTMGETDGKPDPNKVLGVTLSQWVNNPAKPGELTTGKTLSMRLTNGEWHVSLVDFGDVTTPKDDFVASNEKDWPVLGPPDDENMARDLRRAQGVVDDVQPYLDALVPPTPTPGATTPQ